MKSIVFFSDSPELFHSGVTIITHTESNLRHVPFDLLKDKSSQYEIQVHKNTNPDITKYPDRGESECIFKSGPSLGLRRRC
uniref:Uncharacterized protein n=1 Tax=Lepeophtheirus salmonis TaxID=72036 RepID=A0A0K2TWV9_LEPSM